MEIVQSIISVWILQLHHHGFVRDAHMDIRGKTALLPFSIVFILFLRYQSPSDSVGEVISRR